MRNFSKQLTITEQISIGKEYIDENFPNCDLDFIAPNRPLEHSFDSKLEADEAYAIWLNNYSYEKRLLDYYNELKHRIETSQNAIGNSSNSDIIKANASALEGGEIKTLSNQEVIDDHDVHMGSQSKGTEVTADNVTGTLHVCAGEYVYIYRNCIINTDAHFWGYYTGSGAANNQVEPDGQDYFSYGFYPTTSGYYRTYIYRRPDAGSYSYSSYYDYKSVYISVHEDPSISISGGGTICAGSSRTLTASVSGGTGTQYYQWQRSTNGGSTWSNVGSNSSTYNTGGLASTRWYRCIRSASGSGCNTAYSNMVTVSVQQPPTAPTSISGTSTICQGESTTLTVSGGSNGSGATYQWYTGGCGSGYIGSGSSRSVSPMSTTTYYVRRQGTTTCTNTTSCASITVTVNQVSIIPTSVNAVVNP
ncbi:MAG: hypothetical protein PF448_09525 [Bacteroidales bacterium]|nr:hypothetical protein [Bacteroidales bacterium]